ncbi:hypothetical protein [Dyella sp. 2HG41-7]|uniref:hypothetical protein n=1 Tax=Dyella sp. 2HG41-7 TaxID=2883239 RepID=UPI001F3D164B|nr:hypothetical protein [Dyella sp. 2HG41-7]
MGESNDSGIAALLLGFSGLDKFQREKFMGQLNHFIYVSSRQKRKLVDGWLVACRESADPAANMIAESMAEYVVHDRKPIKGREVRRLAGTGDESSSAS